MAGEVGFREADQLERGVGRVVVYPIAPIAEHMEKGPTMWGQWGLCEEKKVRAVLVQHRDDVNQRGVVSPCLLSVDGKEFVFYNSREGGCRVARGGGLVSSGRC